MKTTTVRICRLCKNLIRGITEYQGMIVDNNPILMQTENFFLVPDLSPVSAYHLLIVSKKHYHSMSVLPEELLCELSKLCEQVCERIQSAVGGSYAVFEHGTGNESVKSFNSINHFHLHIVSFNGKLSDTVEQKTACKKVQLSDFSDIKEFAGKEYIFVRDYDRSSFVLLFEQSEIKSQLLRKIIFEQNYPKFETLNTVSYNWKKGIDLSRYSASAELLKSIFL